MTRIYSSCALQEEANPGFDIVERALWESIVQELERFDHETC
ncbi:hypothetical protein [Dyella mobilis]|nr:hypothetical protein [Dyella mobilis]